MPGINAYIAFDGNCREAMSFYRDCLGGELKLMTVGESPMAGQLPKEKAGSIMHASLNGEGFSLMASDRLDHGEHVEGSDIGLMLQFGTEEETRAVFAKLAKGGRVETELKMEFWGAMYGELIDRHGIRWMFNFEKPKA